MDINQAIGSKLMYIETGEAGCVIERIDTRTNLLSWRLDDLSAGHSFTLSLDLRGCELTDAMLSELMRKIPNRVLCNIKSLYLQNNLLVSPWQALGEKDWHSLTHLDLRDNSEGLKLESIEELQKTYTGNLMRLVSLYLENTCLHSEELVHLAKVKLPVLTDIVLNNNPIKTEGLENIFSDVSTIDGSVLIRLGLSRCLLDDSSLEYLSRLKFYNLESLHMSSNGFTSHGIEKLITMKLEKLRSLDMGHCGLNDACVMLFNQMKLLNLESLYLMGNNISEASKVAVLSWYFPSMQILEMEKGSDRSLLASVQWHSQIYSWLYWLIGSPLKIDAAVPPVSSLLFECGDKDPITNNMASSSVPLREMTNKST